MGAFYQFVTKHLNCMEAEKGLVLAEDCVTIKAMFWADKLGQCVRIKAEGLGVFRELRTFLEDGT